MYRLVLYVLFSFFSATLFLSLFGFFSYTVIDFIISLAFIILICSLTNAIFSRLYHAPTNAESAYITAFILFFIITPAFDGGYHQFFFLALWASILAMASKYILAIKRKHIFNPAAVALVLTYFAIGETANWWIGIAAMLPFVLVGGFLIVRKIHQAGLVWSFAVVALMTISIFAFMRGADVTTTILGTLKNSAFFFFAFIMLVEPMTSPSGKWQRVAYAVLVGFLFAPSLHIGSIYSTPELALVVGNLFAYLVSPKDRFVLKLKKRINVAQDTFDFVFNKERQFSYKPGQYMEWTLKHPHPDSRGDRRYFTLASAPTENEIRIGTKFDSASSSFKKRLLELGIGEKIVASQISGDFVLPENREKDLIFIAGGIGITPFRSMIKYLLDNQEEREVTLFYSNKKVADIAYREVFDQANTELGIKTLYCITDEGEVTSGANMRKGLITAEMIEKEVPDFRKKIFYLSGPRAMVKTFEATLASMGVATKNIKTDYFPGYS